MADLLLDLRYAWRRLTAAPSFALISIGTLAAGIGVTTAVYSLIYAMMFRPMPIADIERVVNINQSRGTSGPLISFSWLDYQDLRSAQTVFAEMAAWTRVRGPLTGAGPAEIVLGEAVEGTYFELLRVAPPLGRAITASDDLPSAPPVAVISDRLWRTRFGADPSTIGRVVRLSGQPFEIVGVAPAWFRGVDMPNVAPTALWVPLEQTVALGERGAGARDRMDRDERWLRLKARLAEGRTLDQAAADVSRIGAALDAAFPAPAQGRRRSPQRAGWHVVPAASVRMHESIDRLGVPISYGVMAALALVLLVACVNIANLLLARAASRRTEMATRVAIGASRWRLFRQLITESSLLCILGGIAGLFVAFVLTRFMALEFNIGRGFEFGFAPRLEWPVLLVAMGATMLAGLVFGLAPAVQGARTDVRSAMAGAVTYRRRRISGRRMLVVMQLAVSVALLAVGSVFIQAFVRYARYDPSFDLSRTALATFELEFRFGDDHDTARRFLERLRDRAAEVPGVTAAAVVSAAPIGNPGPTNVAAEAETESLGDSIRVPRPRFLIAGPGALEIFGIPLVQGRFFDDRDAAGAPAVTVISESAARAIFGTAGAIGRRLRFLTQAYSGEPRPVEVVATVVGITRDADVGVLGGDQRALMFVPFAEFRQHDRRPFAVAVRTAGDPDAAASALSVLARRMDSEVVTYVNTGPNILANEIVPTRIGAGVTGGLGALAFVLAVVGLYGVMSHMVAMRTREIGIRMALGAESRRVVRLILKEGVGVVMAGAAGGVVAAYWIVTIVRRLIFGLEQQNPSLLFAVTTGLAVAALVACWIPARRAARVDPNVALRHL